MARQDPAITPDIVAAHGIKPDEYARFVALIGGRTPTWTELGIVSAMWNEHCSYKSSRLHLRGLPTKAPQVIQGPGENAGVIDIGDGLACVFKMESHNHPSFIEPYQGAATGVGGILRDVFTMGARPIACLDVLRFGSPDHPKTRHLVGGVVAGIGGYGNCFGVPTVGGGIAFDASYDGNILVNAMAVGLARTDGIFYSKATGVGNPIVYLGSKTGRDGIGGAAMASAAFDDDALAKRPTVQVGDPFAEKLLLEACLELMATGAVIAIQDMGAAGLTSSAVEMGAKGDLGIELDLDHVPRREAGMTAYEMMLSESQERMLMVLDPAKQAEAEAVFRKWELDFAVDRPHHRHAALRRQARRRGQGGPAHQGARRPGPALRPAPRRGADEARDRAGRRRGSDAGRRGAPQAARHARPRVETLGLGAIRPPDRRQYDRGPRGRRRRGGARRGRPQGPGAGGRRDAALLRGRSGRGRAAGRGRGLAQPHGRGRPAPGADRQPQLRQSREARSHGRTRGLHPRHRRGGAGARLPDRVRQRVALQRDRRPRHPADPHDRRRRASSTTWRRSRRSGFRAAGEAVLLVGETQGWLGQSLYLRDICGRSRGRAAAGRSRGRAAQRRFVRRLIRAGSVTAVHDLSDGGLAVGLAEMTLARGIGATLDIEALGDLPSHAVLFGEDQGRYLVSCTEAEAGAILAATGAASAGSARRAAPR